MRDDDDGGAWAHHDDLLRQQEEQMNQKTDSRKIAEYSPTEQALAELRTKYENAVFECATTAGDKAARGARKEMVTLRSSLESKRKQLKAPALEYAKRIDTEAKRIEGEILALEGPIDAQIRADEQRREADRAERERQDKERRDAIQRRILAISSQVDSLAAASSADVDAAWHVVDAITTTAEEFGEFQGQAQVAKCDALDRIAALYEVALNRENSESRLRAEREELDRRKAEQDARDREAQKQRDAEAEALRLEREEIRRQQADLARQQKAIDDANAERDRVAREQAQAEHRRLADEQAVADRARQAAEKRARDDADAESRRQREIKAKRRPSDAQLMSAIATAFAEIGPTPDEIVDWIADFDVVEARRYALAA